MDALNRSCDSSDDRSDNPYDIHTSGGDQRCGQACSSSNQQPRKSPRYHWSKLLHEATDPLINRCICSNFIFETPAERADQLFYELVFDI